MSDEYTQTREVTGTLISANVYMELAPVDFDIFDDDTLPTIQDIRYQIEEKLLEKVAQEIQAGHTDIEVDDLEEIATEFLEQIKAARELEG
jgi:hypothetical protein